MREIVNAILYVVRGGVAWRMMPHDFPPWGTVHWYYRRWRLEGTWQRIHDTLRLELRRREGRDESLSSAIIDSQSVKTTEAGGVRG